MTIEDLLAPWSVPPCLCTGIGDWHRDGCPRRTRDGLLNSAALLFPNDAPIAPLPSSALLSIPSHMRSGQPWGCAVPDRWGNTHEFREPTEADFAANQCPHRTTLLRCHGATCGPELEERRWFCPDCGRICLRCRVNLPPS